MTLRTGGHHTEGHRRFPEVPSRWEEAWSRALTVLPQPAPPPHTLISDPDPRARHDRSLFEGPWSLVLSYSSPRTWICHSRPSQLPFLRQ